MGAEMSKTEELRDRIVATRKRMEARVAELKADTREKAREERQRLQTRLDELSHQLKDGVDHAVENAAGKLNEWLKKVDGSGDG